MSAPPDEGTPDVATMGALLAGVGSAFSALGRVLLCLDDSFRVLHASGVLSELVGADAAARVVGRPANDLLGPGLFDPSGAFREALLQGERREGWRSRLVGADGEPLLVSVTAAPFEPDPGAPCDPRVKYIVVLRPADQDEETGTGAPMVFAGMIGRSQAMLELFGLVENLSHSEVTVLIVGESGTGKEVLARAIHQHSPRRDGPFVAVNCGALPDHLLEAELFGHVRGAFTGAVRDRVGRFELAEGGTLFLDEVGELPLPLQVKLLRVLQERTFERVGESRSRNADVRFVAATNRDLKADVAAGRFRDDLYYRLRVVPLTVPPLRERRADIGPLAKHLLRRVGVRQGRAVRLSPSALRALLRFDWPGNVRELENALEYAVAVCQGQTIHSEDLPAELASREPEAAQPGLRADNDRRGVTPVVPMAPESLAPQASDERELIRAALTRHQWRRGPAARALGISRTTLWRKMRELGFVRPEGET